MFEKSQFLSCSPRQTEQTSCVLPVVVESQDSQRRGGIEAVPYSHDARGIWKHRFHLENESNVFRSHNAGESLKTQQHVFFSDLCSRKTRSRKSRDYCDVIVSEKFRFQNVFRSHEIPKPSFPNSSGLKSVFVKLRFYDVIVWTEELTVDRKLRFKNLKLS